jgi:hypothetical protein
MVPPVQISRVSRYSKRSGVPQDPFVLYVLGKRLLVNNSYRAADTLASCVISRGLRRVSLTYA